MLGPTSPGYKIPQRNREKTSGQLETIDPIPGRAGREGGRGKLQRPQKGVGTEGEKVGLKEQEQ